MSKESIQVTDFNLFVDVVKSLAKFAEAAKFTVSENGLAVYSKNSCARSEIVSNAISSKREVEFNVMSLQTLLKILMTVKEVHEDDYSDFKFTIDGPAIRFESKKLKTKLMAGRDADLISQWVSSKVVTPLKPVFEFTTTSDMIKRLNSHSFILSDASSLRIYLTTESSLEKNSLYATIGNETNDLNNSITLKFGLVTFGSLQGRKLVLDFDRLNIFNTIPSNDIKIQLMDKNVLVSNVKIAGNRNNTTATDSITG